MINPKEIGNFLYEAVSSNRDFLNYRNIVLVGNNSVGKTQSLKALFSIVKEKKDKSIYYIDSQNRVITDNSIGENTISKIFADFDVLEIIEARTNEKNMAQHDVFSEYESGPITVISELIQNIEEYSVLLKNTIGISLSIMENTPVNTLLAEMVEASKREQIVVNNTNQQIESLSSSEASKIRIIMEVHNAYLNNCKAVVIDEFDIHFDNDQISQFINIIVCAFPDMRFIFVIHDPETLVNIRDMDALVYNIDGENGIHKVINTNDIQEIAQIHRLRSKYLGKKGESCVILEECVAQIIENGSINDEMVSKYNLVEEDKLTSKERVWYSYIQKRIENVC